jgi:hypothetical protein
MKTIFFIFCLLALTLANIHLPLIPQGNITKLYAHDNVANTYHFGINNYGKHFTNVSSHVVTIGVDIKFDGLFFKSEPNCNLLDLGTQSELAARYNYYETVGNGQGFSSIHFANSASNSTLYIKTKFAYFQSMNESVALFTHNHSRCVAAVHTGHVYLLRISDERKVERVVKFLVISFIPNVQVTLRYYVMSDLTKDSKVYLQNGNEIRSLYLNDPIARTLSVTTGNPTNYFCDLGTKCSVSVCASNEVDFDFTKVTNYYNYLYLGSVSRKPRVINIGNEDMNSTYTELYSSLELDINYRNYTYQDRYGYNRKYSANDLYTGIQQNYIYPRVGDVYLVSFEQNNIFRIVKIKIIEYRDGVITLRYKLLKGSPNKYILGDNGNKSSRFVHSRMSIVYAKDFFSHSFNLISGRPGNNYCDSTQRSVCNFNSDFDYNNYNYDAITAGIEGSVIGRIVNITSQVCVPSEYPSIYLEYGSIPCLKKNGVTINESSSLLLDSTKHYTSVVPGNTYVIRDFTPNMLNGTSSDKIAKLIIVDYKPNEFIVFRWDLLYPVNNHSSSNPHHSHQYIDPVYPHNSVPVVAIIGIAMWIYAVITIIVSIVDCVRSRRRAYVQVSTNDNISAVITSENL